MVRLAWVAIGILASVLVWQQLGFAWGLVAALAVVVAYLSTQLAQLSRWAQRPLKRPEQDSIWRRDALRIGQSLRSARARARRFASVLRQMRRTADSIPDGLVVVRGAGEIEYFNQSARRMLGLLQSDRGKNLFALIRDPDVQALLAGGGEALVEIDSPVTAGARIEMRRVKLQEERDIVIARDVTELNRLLTLRRDFVANISHELRTPLTVILGYLESLTEEKLGKAQRQAAIAKLERPARRMQALAEDLLTLTNLESSPYPDDSKVTGVVVDGVLQAVVEEARNLSGGKHDISLESDATLAVEGVFEEIYSAFHNLVSNAVRYSPNGGHIRVRWMRRAEGAVFEVSDEGVGIAAEHLSRLTERFYRVDFKSARVRGGTGLGLAIVKHVLRRHGSVLQVESTPGEGSRFWFLLPHIEAVKSCSEASEAR
ncbi:MAG: phosphate regulon sensor histidine kinase PhoR [Gammaproteobacteria bacterium]|nr:phosphate regulon sensor histidine kinase PhoR [Gammaproteobacteria bacterium]